MKKWEEERKRKQYAEKINKAKPTLKTQPKGAKVVRTSTLNASGQYGGTGRYGSGEEPGGAGQFPSRGKADYAADDNVFEMQQMNASDQQNLYQNQLAMMEQQQEQQLQAMEASAGGGAMTGEHGGSVHGMMGPMSSGAQMGMFMAGQQDFEDKSPATNVPNMNYKHIMAMNAPQHSNQMRKSQREAAREASDYQHRLQRESGGTVSGFSGTSGMGSQHAKPKMRISQSNASSNATASRKMKQFSTDFGSAVSKKTIGAKRGPHARNAPQLTELPLYPLLKAFKLQQYTLKMHDLGYGQDVYKLALLNPNQREDFVEQLKVMPGHKAKIAGFFSVIDEIYPRQKVLEQISAVTPQRNAGKGTKKGRITSAGRTRYHLGPQKTLLQQYEKLDKITKQSFNRHFLQSLEGAKQSIGQLISQHVDVNESTNAINQIFPPESYFGNAQKVLRQAQARKREGKDQDMEDLVNQFTTATGTSFTQQSNKQNRKSRSKQAGRHDQQQQASTQKQQRGKSGDRVLGHRSQSKEKRLKDIDKISQEVERKLKLQRKQEKERIKQYGQIYGGAVFGPGSNAVSLQNMVNMAATGSSRLGRPRSTSKDKRLKSHQSSRISRDRKQLISQEKPLKNSRRGSRSRGRPLPTSQAKAPLFKQSNTQKQMQLNQTDDLLQCENSYESTQKIAQHLNINVQTDSSRQNRDLVEQQEKHIVQAPGNSRYTLPEDSYEDSKNQDIRLLFEQLDVSASKDLANYQQVQQDDKEERSMLEPEVNLFKSNRMFEDTTGGTSGIDIEAVVADIGQQNQIIQDQVLMENEDSRKREIEDDNYSEEQESLDSKHYEEDMVNDQIGKDISGIQHDDNEVVVKRDDESLDISIDVQERQDQQSMEPSPQDVPSDEEGQFDESRQSQQLELNNPNSKNEDVTVATPDVDIHMVQKDRGAESGLAVDDLAEETPQAVPNEILLLMQNDAGQKKQRPMSPLLVPEEKEAAWNLGQSLDSKKVTSALGYLDLKQICYCLAQALNKHIEFSRGQFFLDDLKNRQSQNADKNDQAIEFSYNLGPDLKIDIDAAKQKQQEKKQKKEQSNKEFEQLMKKMESAQPLPQKTPKQLTNTKYQSENGSNGSKHGSERLKGRKGGDEDEEDSPVDEVIADETPQHEYAEDEDHEDVPDQKYIEDFYDEDTEHNQDNNSQLENPDQLDMDMDYSKTQLDDFLKSQSNRGLSSQQLLQSFVSTYNKTKNTSHREAASSQSKTGGAGLLGPQSSSLIVGGHQKNLQSISSAHKMISASDRDVQPIDERENEESHEQLAYDNAAEQIEDAADFQDGGKDNGDDYDTTRTPEVVNLDAVGANKDAEHQRYERQQMERAGQKKSSSAKFEQFDVSSKQGFKELLRFQMRIFDQNYDFEQDQLVGGEAEYQGDPSLEELYYFSKYVIIAGRMEKEIPILCLVYIERFLTKTGLLMNFANWKRMTLISLILASKIWDDDSLENVHFPQVMGDITLKEITGLEKVFLQLIDFDLVIRGSEYAKYYFILKAFAESFNSVLPMGPLDVGQMSHLQNNTLKAESELRDRYNIKLSLKKTM